MSAVIGVLLDVSGSMAENIPTVVSEPETWAQSIFKVADNIIKFDVSCRNLVFALGVGALEGPAVFDILNTIKRAQGQNEIVAEAEEYLEDEAYTLKKLVRRALIILETNGAPSIQSWATVDLVEQVTNRAEAAFIVSALGNDSIFRREFVERLPNVCRKEKPETLIGKFTTGTQQACVPDMATKHEIKDLIRRANESLRTDICENKTYQSIFKVREAMKILKSDDEMSKKRFEELLEKIRPYIFGDTPLNTALEKSLKIFEAVSNEYKKIVFILSDGMPNDGKQAPLAELKQQDIMVIGCYITRRHIRQPRRLYCKEQPDWDEGARYIFNISSTISTQKIPRTIFVKQQWTVDFENNETKLFLQVNHPDLINEVCQFARDVVFSQDSLSDVLSTVSLDLLINQQNEAFQAPTQEGPTCYANAVAAVLYLAMRRIYHRHNGYPDFDHIRQKIIAIYSKASNEGTKKGVDTEKVLKDICYDHYRLRYVPVDTQGALLAIASKRPVIARFRLSANEWKNFHEFYRWYKRGILTRDRLGVAGGEITGHAVVLTSYDCQSLRLMNSWGTEWGDGGFFNIENARVLNLEFFDVFWNEDDLFAVERRAYKESGSEVARGLVTRLTGLKNAHYRCPIPSCRRKSLVKDFQGTVVKAICPECNGEFDPYQSGAHDITMSLYLLSLCRRPTTDNADQRHRTGLPLNAFEDIIHV